MKEKRSLSARSMSKPSPLIRCPWPTAGDTLYLAYHDDEWGVPVRDDRKIYEFLVLEVFQAGLSWRTVLYKRENFRKAFSGFDYRKVARFGKRDVTRLLKDAGIIRNRLKIEAAIHNAQRFLDIRREHGTFADYMWSWVKHKPIVHNFRTLKDYPPFTDEAVAWAKDLKQRGFKFLGPTVLYAHMQAVGMVNDHTIDCFRRDRV
jgi:DNA-3-methyladenine glycosylase I